MIKAGQTKDVDYEILIVGGGPAGVSTWLHLNKQNPELAARCLLIEKEKYPREKICGGALGGWTEKVLEHLHCRINVPSVPINTAECRFGDEVYHHKQCNFFRIVRRIEFDDAFARIAVDRGLQLSEHECFIDMLQKDTYLVVRTNRRTYKVRVLIGADGAFSKVRNVMKPLKKARLTPAIEVFSPAHQQYDPEFFNNTVTIDFSPVKEGLQGYVWHFPYLYEDHPFMNHGIGDFRIHRDTPRADLKKIFTHELQARNIPVNKKDWSSHPITIYEEGGVLSRQNIVLVGDAAGIDSAVGGGIHLALSYGDVAAATLMNAFEQNDFSFEDYTIRFQNHLVGKYIRKLNFLSGEMYKDTTKILPTIREIFSKR
jgi:menaquinone-9 beta-reductase